MADNRKVYVTRCETCDYRSEHATRSAGIDDALKHRAAMPKAHLVKVDNPPGVPPR